MTLDEGDHYLPFWAPDAHRLVHLAAHDGRESFNTVDIETGAEQELCGEHCGI